MREAERLAHRDFSGLRRWACRWVKLTDEFFASLADRQVDDHDDMAFVSLGFLAKQANHLRAIRRLGRSRDTQLVARSMIEGMCLLTWMQKQDRAAATRWRAFCLVVDWRILRERRSRGEQIDDSHLKSLEVRLAEKGEQFLSKAARKAKAERKPLPEDPYQKEWSATTFKQVCEDVGRTDKWATSYRSFCDWHHWNPAGVMAAISTDFRSIRYTPHGTRPAAEALANGIECLIGTLRMAESTLDLGFDSRIADLAQRYIAWSNRNDGTCRGVRFGQGLWRRMLARIRRSA